MYLFCQSFDVFKNFYLAKHSGRILTLQPSAGTADLNALFFGSAGKKSAEDEETGEAQAPRYNFLSFDCHT